jgi:hypothetical protein
MATKNNKPTQQRNNNPQQYKETERFTIRRATFWLSICGFVYSIKTWDLPLMGISFIVFVLVIVAKFISENKAKLSRVSRRRASSSPSRAPKTVCYAASPTRLSAELNQT